MVRPDNEGHTLGIEMLEAEAGHQLGVGEAPDHQVEIAGAQLREQHRILARHHPHDRPHILLLEQADRKRHDPRRHGRQGTDLDRHPARGARLADGIDALAQCRHARARIAQEHIAEARQRDATPAPLEQRHAQHLLQLADGLGNGRLGNGQSGGRLDHALLARDLQEALQVAVFHPLIKRHPFPRAISK